VNLVLVSKNARARRWVLQGALSTTLALVVTACGFVRPLGDDSSSSSSSASTSTDTGISCGADPQSGVVLCLGTTECKETTLDLDDFPDCGFRTTTGTYDLECVCNGNTLCPVGTATRCEDLPGLFAKKSLADICNQDGCTEVTKPATAATTSTPTAPSTRSSTCDPDCAADCASSPPCLQACGC
jgi:hypothetical protein